MRRKQPDPDAPAQRRVTPFWKLRWLKNKLARKREKRPSYVVQVMQSEGRCFIASNTATFSEPMISAPKAVQSTGTQDLYGGLSGAVGLKEIIEDMKSGMNDGVTSVISTAGDSLASNKLLIQHIFNQISDDGQQCLLHDNYCLGLRAEQFEA